MSIEEIPSNEVIVMTSLMHRSFNAGGCDPMCHCCTNWIKVGDNFKLSTVNTFQRNTSNSGINFYTDANAVTKEVMLCDKCTAEDVNKFSARKKKELSKYMKSVNGGCYRINGKIVH